MTICPGVVLGRDTNRTEKGSETMMTIKEITSALKGAEAKLPDVVRAVQGAIRETLKRVDERGKVDAGIDADLVKLSQAAAERDQAKIDGTLAAIATKRAARARLTAEIEAATEDSGALLAPLTPGINAAIAVGPALAVLAEHWHGLDSDVQTRIAKTTERHVRW